MKSLLAHLCTLVGVARIVASAVCPLAAAEPSVSPMVVRLEKTQTVSSSHLIVPVANYPKGEKVLLLQILEGTKVVQTLNVALPEGNDAFWLAA